ncbi:MAG TPA: VOC family protein [Solirubrobacteraceae bacterium]|nr:VOC family protein [Solirubrobacteraceae bacterium]
MSNANLGIVLDGWIDALRRHDLDALERHLRPDVVWQGVRDDLSCPDREHVLGNIRSTAGRLPEVEGIDLSADGDQVLLGVRSPDLTEVANAILDGAIYNVFTIQDGLIARIEDFRTREEAVAAMRAHRAAGADAAEPASRVPATPVADLIAFVHVADVARSIAFYELLGFTARDSHRAGDRLDWAAVQSGDAKLMLAHAGEPVHPGHQGVLFYLYADDLAGLQRHLRAHGVRVGAICDGSPGPKQEMRLRDPDGYVLMVAQRGSR